MPLIQRLTTTAGFPPTREALEYPNGLLAIGGELSVERLLTAYRLGIFPWYEAPQPVMWWTPDPRAVLYPRELHISRSLARTLRRNQFSLAVDEGFDAVMRACAAARKGADGTWIGADMLRAYNELHRMGFAHSVEVYNQAGVLVGGLYGLALGRVFFGESMFSRADDASKVALVALVHILKRGGFGLIDCQVESTHLSSMGARTICRLDFERELDQTVGVATSPDIWALPATCGDLP